MVLSITKATYRLRGRLLVAVKGIYACVISMLVKQDQEINNSTTSQEDKDNTIIHPTVKMTIIGKFWLWFDLCIALKLFLK